MNLSEWKKEVPIIFKKVKDDVQQVLNLHRKGITLALVDMGISQEGFVSGMHFHPGTDIVINKSLLRIILKSQTYDIIWAYTYHILLRLYLKSLGILNEPQCNRMTLKVSKQIFKKIDHPAIIMAKEGIEHFFPDLRITYIPPDRRTEGMPAKYITGFDEENQDYYS